MNMPLVREGVRLTYITFADPIRDRITEITDTLTVLKAVMAGKDPRDAVLARYHRRMQ